MASVFLSYDRDDGKQARPIATAIEKAGHSVWWDKHISGGTQYSKEIERALNSADLVVVLWTTSSIESPWVRDEAGAGRDKGRLVPISLEGTPPPLGFRQFQSIDLGRWQGRGKVPRLDEILQAIERQSKSPGIPPPMEGAPTRGRRQGPSLSHWALIGVGIGLFFVIVGLLIGRPWERSSSGRLPTVRVSAADDSPASKAAAQALYSKLNELTDIAAGKWQLVVPGSDGPRPGLILQAARTNLNATVTLLDGRDQSALWSRDFAVPPGRSEDQASLTAARALGCAAEGLKPGGKPLSAQLLKVYVTGCSQLDEAAGDDMPTVTNLLQQVVRQAPGFKAGWAKLLLAEGWDGPGLQDPANPHRQTLQRSIDQARKLDPKMPEIAIAEEQLLPRRQYGEAIRLLDDAHANNPGSAQVLAYRTDPLMRVGRMADAIADAAQAVQLDPTSPAVLSNYVLTLAYSGRVQAAQDQLRRAESLWAGTGVLKDLEDSFLLRFGDPKALLNTEAFKESPPAAQLYFRTRADPSPTNVDRFVAMLRQIHARRGVTAADIAGHAQPLGEFHREEEIYRMISQAPPGEDISLFSDVAFRPALRRFRQEPRFMAVAKRMGLVDYWQKSGIWPDFCFTDPDQPYDCKAEAAKLAR